MNATNRFSFATHEGPEKTWPIWSHLLDNGQPTATRITGRCLRHQFETPDGYLLISDMDCPAEETQHFTLLSRDGRVLCTREMWDWCGSFNLQRLEWLDARNLQITIYKNDLWRLTIRPWGIPYLLRRIRLRHYMG